MAVLQVRDIYYDYILKYGVTHALNGVTADFENGKIYSITGRSGSGKTTLLSLIAAFDSPKSGELLIDGQALKKKDVVNYRKEKIGIVFQSYNLIQHLTALENVMLALEISDSNRADWKNKAKEALKTVGLDEKLHKKFPSTLSGGEQQRVAIARALAASPDIILADEPTGNLDNENSKNIIGLLKRLAHDNGKCVIVVTHSEEIATECDVEYHMSDGRIVSERK